MTNRGNVTVPIQIHDFSTGCFASIPFLSNEDGERGITASQPVSLSFQNTEPVARDSPMK